MTSSPVACGFIVEDLYTPQFTAHPIGYTVKAADANISLAFDLGTIASGGEVVFSLTMAAHR